MALANRLVGNRAFIPALEVALTGVELQFSSETFISITGAISQCTLNGAPIKQHETIAISRDDLLAVGAAEKGARNYLAFAGGLAAENTLGSTSTYMSAQFGGFKGRALREGDELTLIERSAASAMLQTPAEFRPPMLDSWMLRACHCVETLGLDDPKGLFGLRLTVAARADRVGVQLTGSTCTVHGSEQMPSAPVFPGVVQCTQEGGLFVLLADAGTTGGYPRVAKVARLDLHLLGQLRPGNRLTLIERQDEDAARELREKHRYWREWLPDIADVI